MGWVGREDEKKALNVENKLSFRGRDVNTHQVQLIKSIKIHDLLFVLPKMVAKRLEKIQRDFLGWEENAKKISFSGLEDLLQ